MSRKVSDIIGAVFFLSISLLLLYELRDVPVKGQIFPAVLLFGLIGFSIIIIIRSLAFGSADATKKVYIFQNISPLLFFEILGLFVLYIIAIFNIGYYVSTFVFSLLSLSILSRPNWRNSLPKNLLFITGIMLFCYFVFDYLLNVPIPNLFE